MYLRRKIDDYLLKWKNDEEHKPLIIKGARQVGKTESIKQFAKTYKNSVYINFAEETNFHTICDNGYSPKEIIKAITYIDNSKVFIPHETLIIFDEISDYPEISSSLKFFKIEKEYDVICSGSMLGVNYKRIQSNSVGYKTEYEMMSMDFEEFLWAKGYDDAIKNDLLSSMINCTPLSNALRETLKKLFIDYSTLGGMPEVVNTYIKSNLFTNVLSIQRELLEDYKGDIKKYAEGLDKTRIINVFNRIPLQLAEENKKFQISKVSRGARYKDYWGCVEWLNEAGIINICYCLHTPDLPMKGNYEETKYKIYFKDTGFIIASLDDESQQDFRDNKNFNVYKGALYENIVGEALVKQGYDLFYYKRENSTLEEDFFLRTTKSLVPVEVKSKDGRVKSLRTLIDSDKYPDIKKGIKLCDKNIGYDNNIYTFPYFCTFLLKDYLKQVDF